MNWRGRTVEYSSDPASRSWSRFPLPTSVGTCDRCPICSRVRSWCRKRFCSLNGLGLAENNPILKPLRVAVKQGRLVRGLLCMEYRCVATSVAGFVQQLVSCYLPHGYWFYVSGVIPPGKDPADIDEKLLAKYGIGVSRSSRARRKAVGIANVHYVRYHRRFLLLATHGFHPFYDDEARSIRDVRRIPIRFEGYSISVAKGGYQKKPKEGGLPVRDAKWRVRVQIDSEMFKGLKAYFEDIAPYRTTRQLAIELADLPFEPYAPVRRQLLNLVRYINRRRESANLAPLSFSALRYRRRIVRPFGTVEMSPKLVQRVVKAAGE